MLNKEIKHIALRLLKALDAPSSEKLIKLIKNDEWDDFIKMKFDPATPYPSIDAMRRDCLALEFLRKADFLPTKIDRAQVARDGFLACEKTCFHTNRYLERFFTGNFDSPLDKAYFKIIRKAQEWLASTLGPACPDALQGRFGPGAVFEKEFWRHRKQVTAYDKLRNTPFATVNLPPSLVQKNFLGTHLGRLWFGEGPILSYLTCRGNRFTTVPKDATKDRGIAVEPGVNVFLQLAVGDVLKSRLLRRNIDLRGTENIRSSWLFRLNGHAPDAARMGQDLHRRKAKEASVSCQQATIDLSNASDNVCLALVELLLPGPWVTLLSQLRSPWTRFSPTGEKKDTRWFRLEKFSSMGNGFTFELETLIFCALAHAVGCKIGTDTFVYGDDIICPRERSADLLAVLRNSGFTPNTKKTYCADLPFRESCGGDFFNGHDVRPFYIKEEPRDPADWISLANNIRHWSIKWSMPELMAVRNAVLDLIPSEIRRCRGPEELGDLVIHDDDGWNRHNRGSIWYIRVWRPVSNKLYLKRSKPFWVDRPAIKANGVLFPASRVQSYELIEHDVSLVAALMGLPADGLAPRDAVSGYRFGRVAYS